MTPHPGAAAYNAMIRDLKSQRSTEEIDAIDELEALLKATLGDRYGPDKLRKVAEVQFTLRESLDSHTAALDAGVISYDDFKTELRSDLKDAMDRLKGTMDEEDLKTIFDYAVDDPAGLVDCDDT